jgi:hypothetical protein
MPRPTVVNKLVELMRRAAWSEEAACITRGRNMLRRSWKKVASAAKGVKRR